MAREKGEGRAEEVGGEDEVEKEGGDGNEEKMFLPRFEWEKRGRD